MESHGGLFGGGVGPGTRESFERARATTTEKCVVALVGVAVLASLTLLVHPWYDASNDAALYISTARSIAAGEGYRYLDSPFTVRPPGFSLLIAPIVAATQSFFPLNLLVSLFGVLTAALLFVYQRSRLGWALALLTALVVWLNPAFQRLSTSVLSDVPGAAALLAALLVARWSDERPSAGREVALGLAIGLAAYVRSANLLLIGGIGLARLIRSRGAAGGAPRFGMREGMFALVACLTIAPSFVRNQLVIPPPPSDQTRLYSYATAMFHVDPGDPASPRFTAGDVLERSEVRIRQMAAVLASRLQTRVRASADDPASPVRGAHAWRPGQLSNLYALALVAALVFQGIAGRDEACWFALCLLLFLLTYFGFQDRLLLPVYLVAFPAAVGLFREGMARWVGDRAGSVLAATALVALLIYDLAPREGWHRLEERHQQMIANAAAITASVDPDARLAAVTGFHWTVLLNRPVYSLHRAVWRARSGEAIEPLIERYGLDTVILDSMSFERPLIDVYLRRNYGEPRTAGDALVWTVRPD